MGSNNRSLFAAYGSNAIRGNAGNDMNSNSYNHRMGSDHISNTMNGGSQQNGELQPLRVPSLGRALGGSNGGTMNAPQSSVSPRGVGGSSIGGMRDAVGVGRRHRGARHGNQRGRRQKNHDQLLHSTNSSSSSGGNNMNSIETSSMFQSVNSGAGASALGSSMTSSSSSSNAELPLLPQLHSNASNHQVASVRRSQPQVAHPVNNVSTVPRESLPMYTEEHNFASVTSIKGLKPGNPNWINQDNFFIIEKFDNRDINFYCVFDGHGENGHHVSRRCREAFPQHIRSSNLDMKRAFNIMQNDLNSCEFDVRCSGATCVLASLCGGRLSVSNCGDSRAVLGRRNPNGSVTAHALTQDHKPDKPEERKRILACGGHLGCRQVLVNQAGRGPISMPVGPCRVWYQNRGETLGLAMSRSLGDTIVHRSGVSAGT